MSFDSHYKLALYTAASPSLCHGLGNATTATLFALCKLKIALNCKWDEQDFTKSNKSSHEAKCTLQYTLDIWVN